jgi:hypothetical protein
MMTHDTSTFVVPFIAFLLYWMCCRPALAFAIRTRTSLSTPHSGSTCPDCGQDTVCSKCGSCHYCCDIDLPCASVGVRSHSLTIVPPAIINVRPGGCDRRPAVTLAAPGANCDQQLPVTSAAAIPPIRPDKDTDDEDRAPIYGPENDDEPGAAPIMAAAQANNVTRGSYVMGQPTREPEEDDDGARHHQTQEQSGGNGGNNKPPVCISSYPDDYHPAFNRREREAQCIQQRVSQILAGIMPPSSQQRQQQPLPPITRKAAVDSTIFGSVIMTPRCGIHPEFADGGLQDHPAYPYSYGIEDEQTSGQPDDEQQNETQIPAIVARTSHRIDIPLQA